MHPSEYKATSTNAKACYSTLPAYGAHGNVHKIVAPKPVSAIPWVTRVHGSTFKPNLTPPRKTGGYATLNTLR